MKCRQFLIFILFLSCTLFADKFSSDFSYLVTLEIADPLALLDEHRDYMPVFFDKWNNLYMPNGASNIVSIFSSCFFPKKSFVAGPNEMLFSKTSLRAYWDSVVYPSSSTATYFRFSNGELIDIISRRGLAFDIASNDLLIGYNYRTQKTTGYVILDLATRQLKPLNAVELLSYLRENIDMYKDLSLREDTILYRGWTWEPVGSKKIWGNPLPSSWGAIDKDNLAYSSSVYTLEGKEVERFQIADEPEPGRDKYITSIAFDYEGNVYFFCVADVYYLGRDWGYEKTYAGIINNIKAELLLHPGFGEFKLGECDKNEAVLVLERTIQKEAVEGQTASWYKIKRPSGQVGWIFGAFLNLTEGETDLLIYDSPAMNLRTEQK